MNKQEMLDAINLKIARTGGGTGPGETGYYLPVFFEDFRKYMDRKGINRGNDLYCHTWITLGEPLDKQSDECIEHVYSLIK